MRKKILKIGWECDADVAQQKHSNIKRYASAIVQTTLIKKIKSKLEKIVNKN